MSSPSIIRSSTTYSATVQMHLVIGARCLGIAQMGPEFMILEEPVDTPAGCGELVIQIDGNEKRRAIYLPDGVRSNDVRTRIAAV